MNDRSYHHSGSYLFGAPTASPRCPYHGQSYRPEHCSHCLNILLLANTGGPLSIQPAPLHNTGVYSPTSPIQSSPDSTSSVSFSSPTSASSQESFNWNGVMHPPPPSQSQTFTNQHFLASPRPVGSPAVTTAAISQRQKEPTFFCGVPGCTSQGFTERHNWLYHMRSHNDERPYPCAKCSKSFRSRSDLTRHGKGRKSCNRRPY
ncbi:hypothetical protein E1B28_010957 [Marasmius oreades]|uniref:C2H2-type domain-containing protein n=1 Tax=Marasmius oreades TaxID=181124 RepID=A0A9P7RT29_9AGAR|nr:uncharacterized protein E1B28_010957 [Marasmius oreades]KAG7089259.1 hypothetical protein E1B28_010957 [Marasmius oreades]